MITNFYAVGIFQEYFNRYLAYLDPPPANTEILQISFQFLHENQVGEVAGWVKSSGRFETVQSATSVAS